jgi:hypothetical protein
MSLPLDPSDLTADWISDALQERHPGARVRSVEQVAGRASTNLHVKLRLTYDAAAGAPESMFAKMASVDPAHRAMVGATGMGAREARFYQEVAPSVAMRLPACHFAGSDDDGAFLLLLEDLSAIGCRFSDGTWGVSPDQAAGALEDLAALHVHYEDPARLSAVRPWVMAQVASSPETTGPILRHVIDENRDLLSDAYVEVAELYLADPDAVLALWDQGPHTLIHGDTHIGNVFLDGDRVGFLDWGLMTITAPMRDVSYFLSMSMTTDDRRRSEKDLLGHYLGHRRALGGSDIGEAAAWDAHRLHTAYTVLASFLSLVPPYNDPDQRGFGTAFRNRSIAALDDLGTADVLRAALA